MTKTPSKKELIAMKKIAKEIANRGEKRMKDYSLELNFGGDVWKIQDEVEKLLGHSSGSGFCFVNGYRDLSYNFKNKNSLKAAVRKVRRLPRKIGCKAWEYVGDYETKRVSLVGVR